MSRVFISSLISYVFLLLAFLLLPNLALALGGFYGFYVTYSALALLTALSLPLVALRRGLSSLDVYTSTSLALTLVALYTALGFLWGFASRPRLGISSLLVSLGIFLVQVLSAEVSRSLALSIPRGRRTAALVLGVLAGMFVGRTLPAIASYVGSLGAPSALLSVLNDVAFNLAVTLLHVYGGFVPAVAFRLVVDGYWRFSPLVLDTSSVGLAWVATSTLVYYGLALYLAYRTPTLRELGSSFRSRLGGLPARLREYLPQVATYAVAIAVLTSIYLRVVPLVIVSGSMEPALEVGDLALVRLGVPADLPVGSVVAFRLNSTIVVHRLVGVEGERLVTKGDANPEPDPFPVYRRSLLGVVVGRIPRVGLLALALRGGLKPFGLLPLAATSVLLVTLAVRRRR